MSAGTDDDGNADAFQSHAAASGSGNSNGGRGGGRGGSGGRGGGRGGSGGDDFDSLRYVSIHR